MRLAYFVRYKLAKLNKVQQVARIMDGTIYRTNLKCKTTSISCHVKPKRSVLYPRYEIFFYFAWIVGFSRVGLDGMDLFITT